jgi:hypothetical protein
MNFFCRKTPSFPSALKSFIKKNVVAPETYNPEGFYAEAETIIV